MSFFKLLSSNAEFTSELGLAVLFAGKLESQLKFFLEENNTKFKETASLGILISTLEKTNLFSENEIVVLKEVKDQRNYLMHNIDGLFSGRINETILPREGLISLDIYSYIDKAQSLNENLKGLAEIVEKRRKHT